MRRIALLVAVLLLVSAVGLVLTVAADDVALAKKPTGTVAGHYTYYIGGDPGNWRVVTVSARGTDPVRGRWEWTALWMPPGTSWSGPVTCLSVEGDNAWLAGPTADGANAVFMFVHDGGSPGTAGDLAFTWGADPWETLENMEALCQAKTQPGSYPMDLMGPFQVVSGNLTVRDGG